MAETNSTKAADQFSTPMMLQYLEIKKEYQDCLLFFRLGDFYELFLDDAKIGSEILGITLTARSRGKDGRIPMAGVPFHAADSYINKLVKHGYKVAICEQLSEPNNREIVQREVIRVVTPGTILDDKSITAKENNYIFALCQNDTDFGLGILDITTGFWGVIQKPLTQFNETITQFETQLRPAEGILSPQLYNDGAYLRQLKHLSQMSLTCFHQWGKYTRNSAKKLQTQLHVTTLKGFELESAPLAQEVAAALLGYIQETQKAPATHLIQITNLNTQAYLILDQSAVVNLELFATLRDQRKEGSLIWVLDHTKTAMGGRLLRDWLLHPLTKSKPINHRLDQVTYFLEHASLRSHLRQLLRQIGDLERLLSRITLGMGTPRDVIQLQTSLDHALSIRQILTEVEYPHHKYLERPKQLATLSQLIKQTIVPEPPVDPKNGGVIQSGIHPELDKLLTTIHSSQSWMSELETKERQRTGISSLKVKFNKVFGYYIEISKANLDKVPPDYDRKQTLVNAERFTMPELKHHEQIILEAELKSNDLEYQIFNDLVNQVLARTELIQTTAKDIATLDALLNFATIAEQNRYVRPDISTGDELAIQEGRHPVIEQTLHDRRFVPNDIKLNTTDQQLMIITGPNMAGKSVLMRQVALITLLAHLGCFVPAKKATISLVDRIFIRSGASDMITSGLSTFMVEMVETATILHQATSKSLIIMDEIGRGTSTYDGISIAWSVAEKLVTDPKIKAKTLFATHYHELQVLAEEHPDSIKNYQMAIKNHKNKPVFLHKLIPGGASHSFGIAVAQLAGIPQEVIDRANQILASYIEPKHHHAQDSSTQS